MACQEVGQFPCPGHSTLEDFSAVGARAKGEPSHAASVLLQPAGMWAQVEAVSTPGAVWEGSCGIASSYCTSTTATYR